MSQFVLVLQWFALSFICARRTQEYRDGHYSGAIISYLLYFFLFSSAQIIQVYGPNYFLSLWLCHFSFHFPSLLSPWLLSAISVASWLTSCFWPEACKVNAAPGLEERLVEWRHWQWHLLPVCRGSWKHPRRFQRSFKHGWKTQKCSVTPVLAACHFCWLFWKPLVINHFRISLPFYIKNIPIALKHIFSLKKKWGQRGE